jgi:hypothetical protein
LRVKIVEREIRTKYLDVSFAAVEHHTFVENRQAADCHRGCSGCLECIDTNFEEEGHIDRIKSFVEWYRLQI